MLKVLKSVLKSSLVCLGIVLFSTQAMAANFTNMSFQGGYPERHPTTVEVFIPFLEETAKAFDNKVTFNYFAGNVLYPDTESYSVFNDGRVDVGIIRPPLFPGVLNLITVVDIPGMAPNSIVGSLLVNDLAEKFPEIRAEYPEQSELFTLWASPSLQLNTITPVKTLEEIKGKKIIAWDAVSREILLKLGANPIRITPTDAYLSLSKGMADGVLCPMAIVRSYKISDVAKYHLILDLGVSTFSISMYKPLVDEFTPEMKAYFEEKGGANMGLKVAVSLDGGSQKDSIWMKELGHEFYFLDAAQEAELAGILFPLEAQWVSSMPVDKQKIAGEILEYAKERSAYYQEEYAKGTYGNYSIK